MEKSTRKVITGSPSHCVHAVCAGGLLDSHVEAESLLEAHFPRRAALIPSRPWVMHQPFRAPISPRGYTPDFLVAFRASGFKAVVETKISVTVDSEYTDLFDRAAHFFRPRGYVFYLLTEFDLMRDDIHKRVKLLTRYAKNQVPEPTAARILDVMARYPAGIPIGSLARKAQVPTHQILTVIAHGALTTGSGLQTDPSALVFTNSQKEIDDEVLFNRWFGTSAWGSDAGIGASAQ
jgi:hypothetical protein